MSGRIYSSIFDGVAVAALQDLFEILCHATACVELLSVHLSQETEVADAAEEMLTIAIQGHTGATTSGSGGSTPAVVPTHLGDAAAVTIVEANNTTEISGGTSVTHAIHNWNIELGPAGNKAKNNWMSQCQPPNNAKYRNWHLTSFLLLVPGLWAGSKTGFDHW